MGRVQTFLRSSRNVESVGNQIPTEKPAKLSSSFVCLLRESYPKAEKVQKFKFKGFSEHLRSFIESFPKPRGKPKKRRRFSTHFVRFSKAFQPLTIQTQAHQAVTISSYETQSLNTQESALWYPISQTKKSNMSLEKSFVDEVALLASEDPTSSSTVYVTQRPANSEILDASLIAPRGKVLIKPPTVTETIKPEEFDWNCNDNLFTEEFIAPESVIAANQGINAVVADVIVPEIVNVNEEESIEIEVPVVQVQEAFEEVVEKEEVKKTMSLDQVWSGDSMFEDEMMPVNPYEIHGDAPVNVDPTVDEAEVDDNDMDLLKFVLDDTIQLDDPNVVEWTKTEEVEEDLATIDMGALIGPSTSRDLPEVIKEEPMDFDDPDWTTEVPEKKRGRGRPRIPRPYPEPPKRPRGRPPTAATVAVINEYDSSTMSEGDQKLVKYRRMRDLNNAASKRCS